MVDVENAEDLTKYLAERKLIGARERPRVRTLTGGVSNRTVLVERQGGESWVIKQALPKLRVDVDWFCDPSRAHVETEGLKWLGENLPAGWVPEFVFEDPQHCLLAMQAIPQPHVNWKQQLLAGQIEPPLVKQFGTLIATMHNRGHAQRSDLAIRFADRTFFEALRLEPYYGYAAQQVPDASRFLRQLIDDTRRRCLNLVHGDYSPKNILVHQQRLVLLDHEVIHWGDPAFDLGFSLTHFLSKAHFVSSSREAFATAARQYWQTYRQAVDPNVSRQQLESFAIRHTLACLLARVAGRSPLEYLEDTHRHLQQRVVCQMIRNVPASIVDLVTTFVERLGNGGQDPAAGCS